MFNESKYLEFIEVKTWNSITCLQSMERFGFEASAFITTACFPLFLNLTKMIQLMREDKRALYCITCCQQVPNQHATTTKRNREEYFFQL